MENVENKLDNLGIVIVDMQMRFEYAMMKDRKTLVETHKKLIDFGKRHDLPIFYLEYQLKGQEHPSNATIYGVKKELIDYEKAKKIKKYHNNGFIVQKNNAGDFFPEASHYLQGDSHLDLDLQEAKVKNIIFTGINRNACVQATAEEAKQRGYRIYTSGDLMNRPQKKDWFTENVNYFETHKELINCLKPNVEKIE